MTKHDMTDDSATDDLGQWLLDQLLADASLSEDLRSLIFNAFVGADELDAVLAAEEGVVLPTDVVETKHSADRGVFLKSIRVKGFRGIGTELHLALQPAPGLTVICGRNGSGKSSIAEALEVAMTGTTHRWSEKAGMQWKEAWRNIHQGGEARIRVQFAVENQGETTIGVDWSDVGRVEDFTSWVQQPGQTKVDGLTQLGWSAPLTSYRPMLSYDELGGMFSAVPSKLYDALALILGLEQISEALKRLSQRKQELAEPAKRLRTELQELQRELESIDDERAVRAVKLLKGPAKLDELEALAAGAIDDSGSRVGYLRQLISTQLVSDEMVSAESTSLRSAMARAAESARDVGRDLVLREQLLEQALAVHEHGGDQACPVCGQGRLDGEWGVRARARLAEFKEQSAALTDAQKSLKEARAAARGVIRAMPEVLASWSGDELPGLAAAREAWAEWLAVPDDDQALAAHLDTIHPRVGARIHDLRQQAVAELLSLDETWAPVSVRLSAWVRLARQVDAAKPRVDLLAKAERWLKDNDIQLKNLRLRPISDKARQIWAHLRQESNVEISGLRLEGANTRRRVAIDAAVDGADAGAISVMSQGELHAMALALFLPRATMPASPFRFVVLDDPVQAMDPAKIDGLVKVLSEIAQDRQIIVLSHDDRLPEAVRRASVPARILEVSRNANSVLAISNVRDPAARYLDDANALLKDGNLPETRLRRALPGILRLATESAARDKYFAAAFSSGTTAETVDKIWSEAKTTRKRVAMAVLGTPQADLGAWLSRDARRRPALSICASAPHTGLAGDPQKAYEDVKQLVDDIKAVGE